ncbi:hypothetical protein PMZ80_007970 [Knufia obscura]|uniref:Uncharacterized protein n=1 Tax=Knufia obscura TaxID=1635080 RepID=A0ABR0RG44_9EURO|nr:hypothetical protein PMZ80_007970 [Knufia obscura]
MRRTDANLLKKAVSNDARKVTNGNSNNRGPVIRNTEDDQKLKTLLPTFCRYHHNHAGCTPALRHNANYKRLLHEGLKKVPDAMYVVAQVEEIYPTYFHDYCAGRSVPPRQKQLMVEFFSAWSVGIHDFMESEEERRTVNGVH